MLALQTKMEHVKRQADDMTCSAADYTVFVRGLPADCTEQEVMEFFSGAYRLDAPTKARFPMRCGCWGTPVERAPPPRQRPPPNGSPTALSKGGRGLPFRVAGGGSAAVSADHSPSSPSSPSSSPSSPFSTDSRRMSGGLHDHDLEGVDGCV
jgi:hypothetical protein